jgi:hypothetical protein
VEPGLGSGRGEDTRTPPLVRSPRHAPASHALETMSGHPIAR